MKFAHLGDCHLGGWRHPELKELNFKTFKVAIERCIKERVDFILISGDLFDSSYPPIDTLKETFREFRRLKESGIPVFLIAGSHDYSVSGKTFLDVLAKSGFCKNVAVFEERNEKIILEPTIYKEVAIYGYPGKKSSLEVEELSRLKLQDSPGFFKILLLHTTLHEAIGSLPVKSISQDSLPTVDYLALGHLHINYVKEKVAYSGPLFPNNLSELEELKAGSFNIIENGVIKRQEIKLKEVLSLNFKINNSLNATEEIISKLKIENLKDKIIILKLSGLLETGKISDIDFSKIEDYVKKAGAFVFLKSTSRLYLPESDIKIEVFDSFNIEGEIIKKFEDTNQDKFNIMIPSLIKTLQIEKLDDEKSVNFEERLISEAKKILRI